jgi:hypothetical protein
MSEYLVRLFSPWHASDLVFGGVRFSPTVPLDSADGALWEYTPTEEILGYKGPKSWYFWEPSWHTMYRTNLAWELRKSAQPDLLLWYGNPDPRFRVPHITRVGGVGFVENGDRIARAVAIVSNFGGYVPRQRLNVRLRNRFILNSNVDLFGRKSSWDRYFELLPIPRFGPPRNFRGEVSWNDLWMSDQQPRFMSHYKVAICLENSVEPFYFTEKFVNAARAGCIPVYHAHPTVADGILRDAKWIDPKDYAFDPNRTIEAALSASIREFQLTNQKWLEKAQTRNTFFDEVWATIGMIFHRRLGN